MRAAHFDCFNGISGDMVLGALVGAGVPLDAIRSAVDSLGLPIRIEMENVRRCGFAAVKVDVYAEDQAKHRHLPQIEAILAKGKLTPSQLELARRIFHRLATAEAAAHGIPIEKVHFHEVGALDSIADIVGCAVGLDLLGVTKFTSSAVPTGSGTITGAHGVMPIPTPGTLELLRGVPIAPSTLKTELTTPTGAAILTSVVTEYVDTPSLTIESIGVGAGTKEFADRPNILRLLVGKGSPTAAAESVWVLETNLDDVPAEIIGYCTEELFRAGALDVYCIPLHMKKQRPGVMLCALTREEKIPALEEILFRETATFGVRRYRAERTILEREEVQVTTQWGTIRAKRGMRGSLTVTTPEYEDCARVAREQGIALREVYEVVRGN